MTGAPLRARPAHRRRLLALALTGSGLVAAGLPGALPASADPAPAPAARPTGPPVPTTPLPGAPAGQVLLGTVGGAVPNTGTDRLDAFQAQAGRQMATVREYAQWDDTWPDALATSARAHHQTPLLSVKTKTTDGSPVSWARIASAKPGDPYDQQTRRWARMVKAYGAPMMFSLNHEPEVFKSDAMGTPEDYVAAWRRIVTVFQQEGVSNAEYVFIGTAFGWGRDGSRDTTRFYPGDAYVDDIAADGYNWYTCRPGTPIAWADPATLFAPFRQFGRLHPTKGLLIGEFGTVEDPADPGRKAQWYQQLHDLLKQPGTGQFRGVAEWYSFSPSDECDWRIDSSASALATFRSWGQDPQFGDRSVPPATVRQVTATAAAGSATVRWAPAGPGGSPVTGYTVTVVTPSGNAYYALGPLARSFTYRPATPAPSGATYTFKVSATNAAGTDRPSGPASAVLTP